MKKLTRKLFVSIMTLVLTAMALGTSTFAWFSTNSKVNATNMQVTAKTDSVFLIIGAENNLANVQSGNATNVAAQYMNTQALEATYGYNSDKKVYLASYATADFTYTPTSGDPVSVSAGEWYTAGSNTVDTATGDGIRINVTKIDEGDENYMLTYKVWLTLAGPASGADVQNLSKKIKVSGTVTSSGNGNATAALVLINGEKLNLKNGSMMQQTSAAVALTSASLLEVTVYVYVDGEHADAKTATIQGGTQLTGTLGLEFALVD